jgi:hypothetical protein
MGVQPARFGNVGTFGDNVSLSAAPVKGADRRFCLRAAQVLNIFSYSDW